MLHVPQQTLIASNSSCLQPASFLGWLAPIKAHATWRHTSNSQ